MDGFKLNINDYKKNEEKTFWGVTCKGVDEEKKELAREQFDRFMGMSDEEIGLVDAKLKAWKTNPALTKNVMIIVPKRSAFLDDEIDLKEAEMRKELEENYEGAKLTSKTRDLTKSIKKLKEDRKKKAMELAKKGISQEDDLEKWSTKHHNKLVGLKGKNKAQHIAGLTTKMQGFVDNGFFIGTLDSDAAIMKAYEKTTQMQKDMLRLKADSDFFAEELDEELKQNFTVKYNGYVAVSAFIRRLVIKMAQGKGKSSADLSEINKVLGENALIKGSSAEKIYNHLTTASKEANILEKQRRRLHRSLAKIDLDAEAQEIRKGKRRYKGYVNESKALSAKTVEIKEKWEKQGEETLVYDEKGNPVMVEKLNPKDYGTGSGGEWRPFLDADGNPVMIQKTVAKDKEEKRKRLNEQTERRRYEGYTEEELKSKLRDPNQGAEADKCFEILNRNAVSGMAMHISGYSGEAFQAINNALRYDKYGKVRLGGGNGYWDEDVKTMVQDLKKDISNELPEEISLTRHGDIGGLACMFGLPYNSVKTVEDLMDKIGQLPDNGFLIRDKAFVSTTLIKDGVKQGGYRQAQVEFRILAPQGTKGLYIEKMSDYPENEQELLLDAGTIFRVTKIDATGKWDSSRATKENDKKVVVYMEVVPQKKKQKKVRQEDKK